MLDCADRPHRLFILRHRQAVHALPGARRAKALKILVADDQKFVRRTLRSLPDEQAHWQIYEAENGKVALNRIREVRPNVVVLDIVMPEMNGIEAAYEISQHTLQTKVILISSYYTPEEAAILGRCRLNCSGTRSSSDSFDTLHSAYKSCRSIQWAVMVSALRNGEVSVSVLRNFGTARASFSNVKVIRPKRFARSGTA
jgi:DNA-binding NarL/FixJ family response regulator